MNFCQSIRHIFMMHFQSIFVAFSGSLKRHVYIGYIFLSSDQDSSQPLRSTKDSPSRNRTSTLPTLPFAFSTPAFHAAPTTFLLCCC